MDHFYYSTERQYLFSYVSFAMAFWYLSNEVAEASAGPEACNRAGGASVRHPHSKPTGTGFVPQLRIDIDGTNGKAPVWRFPTTVDV